MRILIAGLAALVLIAGALAWHIRGGMDTRSAPGTLETVVAQTIRSWSVPSRYRTLKNPVACSGSGILDAAREHWADHCATCHANNGSGDTMLGRTMYPRPPNMRAQETQEQSDGELYYVIKNGVRLTGMPAFGPPGDGDISSWQLVCFIRHLPQMSSDEEIEMRRLNPKTPADLEEEGRKPSSSTAAHHPRRNTIIRDTMGQMMKAVHTSLLALAISTGLLAHGGAEHLTGTVKTVTADSLTIETTKHETLTIALTSKTVAMKSKAKGDLKDLKAGDRVVVHAEKNKAGQFEAEEVDFGPAPASKPAH